MILLTSKKVIEVFISMDDIISLANKTNLMPNIDNIKVFLQTREGEKEVERMEGIKVYLDCHVKITPETKEKNVD